MSAHVRRERGCEISVSGTLIGTATLFDADPSMGVAMGILEPSSAYQPEVFAHEAGNGRTLVKSDSMASIVAGSDRLELTYFLQDYAAALPDEVARQVTVFFRDWETYEGFFDRSL
ncbi:MAG: hypothetical protein AAFR32_02220 [Pseudomonadota bacterium]